jgi:DNA-binding transcriptional MerR regulator
MKIVSFENLPAVATRPEWARLLGISTFTLSRWEQRGLKRAREKPGAVLYRREDVLKHIGLERMEAAK